MAIASCESVSRRSRKSKAVRSHVHKPNGVVSHRVEAVGNFVAQLALPFGLFMPQPVATVVALLMIVTQLYLVVSGNYAWLNWVTIVVLAAAVADPVLGIAGGNFVPGPAWFTVAIGSVTILITVLSYYPVRNLASRYQAMNASFDPFHRRPSSANPLKPQVSIPAVTRYRIPCARCVLNRS